MLYIAIPLVLTVVVVVFLRWLTLGPIRSLDLSSSHVLVTGGSKGIGRAIAAAAIRRGANVSIVARGKQELDETLQYLKQCASTDQKVTAVMVDMTSSYDVIEKRFREIEMTMGPVDVLVCNVGRCEQGRFEEMPINAFEDQMRQNYLSAVLAVRASLDGMKRRSSQCECGCRIVFISSQAGQVGLFGYTAYSPSKYALRGFAEALQMELAAYNIWVTTVFPPNTNTEGFAEEQKTMLPETRLLSDTSGLLQPSYVAEKILQDAANGNCSCCFKFKGRLLHVFSCGMSRCNSIGEIMEPLWCPGFIRLVSLFYLKKFYVAVRGCLASSK